MIKYIFIIPYRNREQQKYFFLKNMEHILEDYDKSSYEIIFSHQYNNLPFNRGAMKNIGFLYAKQKYNYYKNITFIFNDVDTIPYRKDLLNYDVNTNEIKHFYGFYHTLGGIFSIKGSDFEKLNGFPSYWSWGYEDNVLYDRAIANNIYINRSQFYPILDKNIIHIVDEFTKLTSQKNKIMTINKNVFDGLNTLKNVLYNYNENTNMLDITQFSCSFLPNDNTLIPNNNLTYNNNSNNTKINNNKINNNKINNTKINNTTANNKKIKMIIN